MMHLTIMACFTLNAAFCTIVLEFCVQCCFVLIVRNMKSGFSLTWIKMMHLAHLSTVNSSLECV